MSDDDFLKAMLSEDVKPLRKDKRITKTLATDNDIDKEARRQAAESFDTVEQDPLSSEPVDMLEPLALLSFLRPGVQYGVFKNLRMGKYAIDARLDLHRQTVEQARRSVYQFVVDCIANDIRTVLITHGKGEDRAQPALLKSCVAHWLPQIPEVLAFHTAQKHHGSYGATYVLLKKSKADKLKNKKRNTK